jgi:hypothetical protein
MPLPLAASAIIPLAKTAFGAYQAFKGAKIAKEAERPEYEIPEEFMQNLNQAQQMALEGMPAAQKQQFFQQMQRATAAGMSNLQSRRSGVSGVAGVVQQQKDAALQLAADDAQERNRLQQGVMGARMDLAGQKQEAFDFNQYQPYMEQKQAGQGLIGAGIQNIFGGADQAMLPFLGGGGGGFNFFDGGNQNAGNNQGINQADYDFLQQTIYDFLQQTIDENNQIFSGL